ncbi:hypothetical protein DVR12_05660 [Chitinophaga silvatica]|uniref:Uncharacterized protein n=1 Tax=Chitinophaga silvatica TaxID=2282649 RepID=A0A3E1YEG8_9BACT|nr:hypothetical protein [Chitinophaga silvatica]RFS24687.1 hypothetical protein DVR12_05660 [Chitinophaga silvatica]
MRNTKVLDLVYIGYFLPFIYVYIKSGGISPYNLDGKQFLSFYCSLFLVNLVDVRWLLKLNESRVDLLRWVTTGVMVLGMVRLTQGLYNGRSIGYLSIILIVQLFTMLMVWANKKR